MPAASALAAAQLSVQRIFTHRHHGQVRVSNHLLPSVQNPNPPQGAQVAPEQHIDHVDPDKKQDSTESSPNATQPAHVVPGAAAPAAAADNTAPGGHGDPSVHTQHATILSTDSKPAGGGDPGSAGHPGRTPDESGHDGRDQVGNPGAGNNATMSGQKRA